MPDALTEAGELFCPACGYDLRGTSSDRCSECGEVIDRQNLAVSRLPWAHRGHLGMVRAWWRTVVMVTFRPKVLAAEAARPVGLAEARRFRIITSLVVGVVMALILVGVLLMIGGTGMVALLSVGDLQFGMWPTWTLDLALPWSAGAFIWPVLPVGVVLTFILIGGLPHLIFYRREHPPERQQRTAAIGEYTSGLLLWLPLPVVIMAALNYLDDYLPEALLVTVAAMTGLTLFIWPIWYALVTLRLLQATTQCGLGRVAAGFIYLPVAWAAAAALGLGVFPWIVGYLWLVVDSLR